MRWSLLASLFSACFLFADTLTAQAAPALAFIDVNVVPMDRERILAHQTVIVEGYRIVAITPVSAARVPKAARIIDGHGTAWLMPGLADMHSHVGTAEQFPLYLASGVTTFLNLGDPPAHAMLSLRRHAKASDVPAPNMYAAFRLDGPGGNYVTVATADQARQAVRFAAANGYEFIKVYNSLSAEVMAAIGEEAAAHHMGVAGHGVRSVGILGGFRLGESMIAHAEEYLYTEFQKSGDSALVARTVQATREAGAWVTPNLVAYGVIARQWGRPAVVDTLLALPEARWLSPGTLANWRASDYVTRTGSLDSRYQFLRRFTLQLQQAGVPLLVGTDAPDIPGIVTGISVHADMSELVAAGLTPYQALAAATRNAGEYIGRFVRGPRFGVVAPGARADLVLLDANPLADITNARRVSGVVVAGRWMSRQGLDRSLDSIGTMMAEETVLKGTFTSQMLAGARPDMVNAPRLEETLNGVAYQLLGAGKVPNAVAIFRLIASRFPESSNAHESLCEGYVALADTVRAVASCHEALRLDAWTQDASGVLRGLQKGAAPH